MLSILLQSLLNDHSVSKRQLNTTAITSHYQDATLSITFWLSK